MKGVVFNIFESFVVENFGMADYDALLEKVGLADASFVGAGSYDDADFMALFTNLLEMKGLDAETALKLFGEYMFPCLVGAYTGFDEKFSGPRDVVESIDQVIHVEVKKLYPDAVTPVFRCEEVDGQFLLFYHSPRQLPHLVLGLLKGVQSHYPDQPFTYDYLGPDEAEENTFRFALDFAG